MPAAQRVPWWRRVPPVLLALLTLAGAAGCDDNDNSSVETESRGADPAAGCVEGAAADADLFADKAEVEFAENFTIAYHGTYKVVTVAQPAPDAPPETHVLVQCGTDPPELTGELAGAQVVEIPVETTVSLSTTHLPALDLIGRVDTVVGVANPNDVVNDRVRRRIDAGEITEVSPNYQLNAEAVIGLAPDVVFTGGFPDPADDLVRQADVPLVGVGEWLEPAPLGRAEWMKFFAAFFNLEGEAGRRFDEVVANYQALAAEAADVGERPTVLVGSQFEGTWFSPGGESYFARLVDDAGGDYVFAARPGTESLQLDVEAVLAEGGQADVWIETGSGWETLADGLAIDSRHGQFAAFESGDVWNQNAKVGPGGGLDFYETGTMRPDLVLADLMAILHPDLVPDHEPVWHRQVPSG